MPEGGVGHRRTRATFMGRLPEEVEFELGSMERVDLQRWELGKSMVLPKVSVGIY